jgi:hypothetical protein
MDKCELVDLIGEERTLTSKAIVVASCIRPSWRKIASELLGTVESESTCIKNSAWYDGPNPSLSQNIDLPKGRFRVNREGRYTLGVTEPRHAR